jgi:uncharacterized protein (DUF2384 family)
MAHPAIAHQGPKNLAGPGLRTVFRIFDAWKVDEQTRWRLLGVPRATYYRWKRDPSNARLSHDTLERLSYLLGIYKALQILLPDLDAADTWVQRPNTNPLFAGRPPLERMAAGNVSDLYVVRQYLDAHRGWS